MKRVVPVVVCSVLFLASTGVLGKSAVFSKMSEKSTKATDAIVVADPTGRVIYHQNQDVLHAPASTLKVFTSLVALERLGASFKFRTEFYSSPGGDLVVKGYGDPLLVSEVWQEIATTLASRLPAIKDLVLDDTYFSRDIHVPGKGTSTNPYDAPLGALCANFNTVSFRRNTKGQLLSAEPQTPLIPFALNKIKANRLASGRYTFSHKDGDATRYTGELLAYFLRQKGAVLQGSIRVGKVSSIDKLVLTYESKLPLDAVLKRMLEFSNNFIANQVLLVLGATVYNAPGSIDKGVRVLSEYASGRLGLKHMAIDEGSGLSRGNRVSALEMLGILKAFSPYRHLLRQEGLTFYKSGTLSGVRARAGYAECSSQGTYPFVIFLEGAHANQVNMSRFTTDLLTRLNLCAQTQP